MRTIHIHCSAQPAQYLSGTDPDVRAKSAFVVRP